ncbi:MAG TPA: hypothetical protein O0X25_00985 [Methanocorpusculum sp.]|nr:hypothetical protein [Methanocorpusculum sp.]HJJ39865.1 hypothetical protein [Methanocorpusculum sp.]HJJ49182.1 hypothetical protein [Methanocorpusculum sp.]HJJ56840.1 hypothetical protein [Methanocorpusculum sp.]
MEDDLLHISNSIGYLKTFLEAGLSHRPKEYKKNGDFLAKMKELLISVSKETAPISEAFRAEHDEVDWQAYSLFSSDKILKYMDEHPSDFWTLVLEEIPGMLGAFIGLLQAEGYSQE